MELKKIFGTQLFDIDLKDTGDFKIKINKPKFGKPAKDIANKINTTYGLSDNLKEELIEIYSQVHQIEGLYWGLGPKSNAPLLSSDEWIKNNYKSYTPDQDFSGLMNLQSFDEMMTGEEPYLGSKDVRYLPFDIHWALNIYLKQEKGKIENNLYLFNSEGIDLMDLEVGVLDYLKLAAEAKCFYYWQYAFGPRQDFYNDSMKNLLPKFMPKAKLNFINFGPSTKKKKNISESEKEYEKLYDKCFREGIFSLKSDKPGIAEIISLIKGIKILSMADKNLSDTPQEFNLLNKLTHISLDYNKLTNFPLFAFQSKETLKKLNLYHNSLTSLPENLGDLSQLISLNLEGNQLINLPESIGKLTHLKELGLGHGFRDETANQLVKIPESIGNLIKLESLVLSKNKLATLPNSIGELASLEILQLSTNQLETLPDSFGNLSKLNYLNLQDNKLKDIPESVYKLTNLTSLWLGENQIKEIAPDIGNLSELEYLRLDNNPLATLPKEIGKLKKIEQLFLDSTHFSGFLETIDEIICQLNNLKTLWLHDNKLEILPESISNLSKLSSLGLSNSHLKILPESISNLSDLSSLDLSNNHLKILPESISNLSNLSSLDLSNNHLKILPSSIETMKSLKKLYLRGNDFKEKYIKSLKKALPDCSIYDQG
jgi:Leucine-rich repeat (LRR) protein